MNTAKKILLLGLIFFTFCGSVNAQTLLEDQRHIELTVQTALDRILGQGNSIVYISLVGESEKWEINYTAVPEIAGVDMESMGGGGGQQTVVPGIPSLRFLTKGGGSEGIPLNYEIVQRPPIVNNKEVVLILDKKIKMGELRSAKVFITKFLGLDENNGDTLTILKESFSTIQKAGKSASSVTTKKKSNFTPIIIIASIVLLLLIIGIVLMKLLPGKDKKDGTGLGGGEEEDSAAAAAAAAAGSGAGAAAAAAGGSSGSGEGGADPGAGGAGSEGGALGAGGAKMSDAEKKKRAEELKKQVEDDSRKKEEEAKLLDMQKGILGNGERYFNFIDEENIYKLKFLLQVKIALQQATPRTIGVVMACLPFKLAASILVEYPAKIQAEIVNNIIFLQHYPETEMSELEKEIEENISYLFGGKNRLKLIIERIPGDAKKRILEIISSKYPGIANEVNSLIFLFEDLLILGEDVLTRIFGDIDTEVIATALVHIDSDLQKKVVNTLAKGVQAMVDQWLALKANTASKFDIEEARQKVLNYAQHLEREGFIELKNG